MRHTYTKKLSSVIFAVQFLFDKSNNLSRGLVSVHFIVTLRKKIKVLNANAYTH